jgi:phosphoenolpyruvate synthase/pyruvate phosphate dikinase
MVVALDGPIEEVGGKAAGLATLARLGLPVPPAVVVPVSAQGVVEDPEGVIARLGEPLAVRSSGVGEDARERSAAGQFESVMGVVRSELADAVSRVWRSGRSERVQAYGLPTSRMAVVIQRQIEASRAGVAFSRDPVTGEYAVLVECVFGLGEQLVSGQMTPDRFEVGADGRVRARVVPKEGQHRLLRTLRDDEVHAVATLVRRSEEGFGHPVDVEFCFERRVLWLVQCRPLTAARAAAG